MRLINRKEAAGVLGVTSGTIGNWYKSGYLPSVEGSKGFLFDLNVCKSLSEERIKEKERERKKPKAESRYNYYQIKCDLLDEELERFEKIREDLGYKFKGELLRKLILQAIALIDKNHIYIEEREEEAELAQFYDEHLEWAGVGEIMTRSYWISSQYVPKEHR